MPRKPRHSVAIGDHSARDPGSSSGLETLAKQLGWRLVVLFGSTAAGAIGRDIDLAVTSDAIPDLLEQGRWQSALEEVFAPRLVDLVLLTHRSSPVTRFEVFRAGRCLFEADPGLFDRERDRAFFLFADTEWFRRQQREALLGTPS